MNRLPWGVLIALTTIVSLGRSLAADETRGRPAWASLIPFKRVDTNPSSSYVLTEDQGPWLILAANFAGEQAEKQSHELVLELRSRFRMPAYIHKQTYDFTDKMAGPLTPKGDARISLKYANATKYEGIAVLVGNFRSVEDSELAKTLERIKQLEPNCMAKSGAGANEPFAPLKELKRRISIGAAASRVRKPMGNAFVTRNPLIPEEIFAPQGVDDFVAKLNSGIKYSLLENPGKFSVKVATFRGNTTINQREIREIESRNEVTDKLEIAAQRSHKLTMALRAKGIEAYEFHDRHESIVTIGSFQSDGTKPENGPADANLIKTVEKYQGGQRPLPGKQGVGVQPMVFAGICFDVQPEPIPIPRRSVATDYVRRKFE